MEWQLVFLAILVAIIGLVLSVLLIRLLWPSPHKMTRVGLRKHALEQSGALMVFINEREASRPDNDTVIRDHQHSHRRVTLYDEEAQEIYARDYLPGIADLREQFAKRGIRNDALDRVYGGGLAEAHAATRFPGSAS